MSEIAIFRQLRREWQSDAKFLPFALVQLHSTSKLIEAALFRDETKEVDMLLALALWLCQVNPPEPKNVATISTS
jgi:hypothetical protein